MRASGGFDVFDLQDGRMVEVSHEGRQGGPVADEGCGDDQDEVAFRTTDYDSEFVAKQGILVYDGTEDQQGESGTVEVVSVSQLLNGGEDNDDLSVGTGISSQSSFSEGKLAREVENEYSQLESLKEQNIDSGGGVHQAPLLHTRNVKNKSSTRNKKLTETAPSAGRRKVVTPSSSSRSLNINSHVDAPPTPKNKSATLLDPPDFLARQRTNDLVSAFDRKMKCTEKEARKTSRERRKKVRISKKNISSKTAALLDTVRYLSDPLDQTERLSTDFMNQHVDAKWGQKARELILESGPKQKSIQLAPKKAPCLHEIRRMLTRTSSSIAETYQEQMRREEQLLARKSFGPYVTSELVQVFELFKSFPKQKPTPADTVLMAGKDPEKEMGNGLTTSPVYGCIDLVDLVKHRWMRNRPHFKSFLDKVVLISRPDMSAGLFITLNRIFVHICPLLSPKDRSDLSEFFKVYRGPVASREVNFSPAHRAQLKKIFDLFDVNHSNTIDGSEIRAVLDGAYLTRIVSNDSLVGKEEEVEKSVDDASIGSILSEAQKSFTSSTNHNVLDTLFEDDTCENSDPAAIDFPAFLELFGKVLFPPDTD
jgi:hypothetical protein